MKKYINAYALILLLATCFVVACDDEAEEFKGPYTFDVRGPSEVEPEATETYYIGDLINPNSYTWTVNGPAEIVGSNKGLTVEVKFTSVGDVVISVSNGPDAGKQDVTVLEVEPAVSAELNGSGMLKSGATDTVFLSFPAPLAADPVITMLASTDTSYFHDEELAFSSGTLGSIVKIDAQNYYAIYTAGSGNGTPEALITGLETTSTYGSVTVDSTYIQLYKIDNIAPIANIAYSTSTVNDSTVVTVTATFSEAVTFESPLDSALLITFSGGGVAAETDTLEATDDPLVYTYEYIVNGGGNGRVYGELSNIIDLAGNELAIATEPNPMVVDNIAPGVVGFANDEGDYASLVITGAGGSAGMYLILEDGEDAPTTAEQFLDASEGVVASGSVTLGTTTAKVLASGVYDVYFLVKDAAGNNSAVASTSLTMD